MHAPRSALASEHTAALSIQKAVRNRGLRVSQLGMCNFLLACSMIEKEMQRKVPSYRWSGESNGLDDMLGEAPLFCKRASKPQKISKLQKDAANEADAQALCEAAVGELAEGRGYLPLAAEQQAPSALSLDAITTPFLSAPAPTPARREMRFSLSLSATTTTLHLVPMELSSAQILKEENERGEASARQKTTVVDVQPVGAREHEGLAPATREAVAGGAQLGRRKYAEAEAEDGDKAAGRREAVTAQAGDAPTSAAAQPQSAPAPSLSDTSVRLEDANLVDTDTSQASSMEASAASLLAGGQSDLECSEDHARPPLPAPAPFLDPAAGFALLEAEGAWLEKTIRERIFYLRGGRS